MCALLMEPYGIIKVSILLQCYNSIETAANFVPGKFGLFTLMLSPYFFLGPAIRDGFRERGALGHLSFWGPTKV